MTAKWKEKALAFDSIGMSWREIARRLKMPKSTVSDFLRERKLKISASGLEVVGNSMTIRGIGGNVILQAGSMEHPNQRILFISDMHIPYHNKGLLPFLQKLKDKYKPTRVICLGDELDYHALSFHDSDPDLDSAGGELGKSIPVIKQLEEMFPVMDLIDSNHGSMVFRKAKHHGIPVAVLKSYNEVLGVGPGWKWHNDMVLDLPNGQKLYVHHGKTAEAIRTSQMYGMNHVCGHYHESFAVKYWSTPQGLHWAVNSGCLIDNKALAFAYNKVNPKRPIIGTSLVIDSRPILEEMKL